MWDLVLQCFSLRKMNIELVLKSCDTTIMVIKSAILVSYTKKVREKYLIEAIGGSNRTRKDHIITNRYDTILDDVMDKVYTETYSSGIDYAMASGSCQ